ncbi:MAG: pseudaminic acid synthase [Thermotaleaceae bacterium]
MNREIKIKDKVIIGENTPCYMIAEMSANHGGDIHRAIEIIHRAKESGADCIKIQTYTPDTMTIDCDNGYFQIQKGTWKGENLYKLYGKAYTPWEWQSQLKEEAEKIGLDFLSTPFDKTAVDFLEELKIDFYKIASFEVTDIPLIRYIASKGKPIILSTGMATFEEIEEAVAVVKAQRNENICLLRCSSAYPAIPQDMNLKAMIHLRDSFGLPVGLSDHSMGSVAAITAVALGAKIVEKHFCISREIENPDASFSMEAHEFRDMVADIRAAETAMGKINFELSESEKSSRVFRRSIFAVEDIKAGEVFTHQNIRIIRPAFGLEPKYIDQVLGKRAVKDIERGTPLNWNLVRTENK